MISPAVSAEAYPAAWAGAFDRAADNALSVNEPLPPLSVCIAVADEAPQPAAGNAAAVRLAKILIGSYPARDLADSDVYARAIVSVLAEYPASVGRAAIEALTRRSKFYPTRADVVAACETIATKDRARVQVARRMVEEHARRSREAASRGLWVEHQRAMHAHPEARDAWLSVPVMRRPAWRDWIAHWPNDLHGLPTIVGGRFSMHDLRAGRNNGSGADECSTVGCDEEQARR